MSQHAFRKGAHLLIESAKFMVLKKLDSDRWQLENQATGEWCAFAEHDLLDRFTRGELAFVGASVTESSAARGRVLANCPQELIAAAQVRLEYVKEIDRRQPIAFTEKALGTLASEVASRTGNSNPPSWRTLSRDYNRWLGAGRDIGVLVPRYRRRVRGRRGFSRSPHRQSGLAKE